MVDADKSWQIPVEPSTLTIISKLKLCLRLPAVQGQHNLQPNVPNVVGDNVQC